MSEEAAEWWQLQRAAGTLAEAFLDDPVMCFLFAEPAVEKRVLLMQAYFAAKLAASGGNKTIKVSMLRAYVHSVLSPRSSSLALFYCIRLAVTHTSFLRHASHRHSNC